MCKPPWTGIPLSLYGFSGQHQQNPSPSGGGIFKRWWFKYWKPKGMVLPDVQVLLEDGTTKAIPAVHLPDTFWEVAQSWDMSFKDLDTKHLWRRPPIYWLELEHWRYEGLEIRSSNDYRGGRLTLPTTGRIILAKGPVRACQSAWKVS